MTTTTVHEISKFALLASDTRIKRTAKALESNNIQVFVVETGAEAKTKLFEILPANAEVFTANSATLNTLGIPKEIENLGHYDSVRAKLGMLDAQTQQRDMQKMGATPEYMIGSVHAITETGSLMIASATGSQLAGYASGAAHVIWVVGAQKIVPTFEDGMKRILEYTFPLEDARLFKAYGMHSSINKVLIINKEFTPGRATVILVKENLGF